MLFFGVFSGIKQQQKVTFEKLNTEKGSKSKESKKSNQFFYNNTNIEAVVSAISLDFTALSVDFPSLTFHNYTNIPLFGSNTFLPRPIYLEILFEHLVAPNAP